MCEYQDKDGFALEAGVRMFIAKGMFEMRQATKEMDLYGGTDFVFLGEGFKVSLGLTLRNDICKWSKDADKWAYYAKTHKLWAKYAPLHIELVVNESDALDWDAAMLRGLMRADEIVCEWEGQEGIKSWEDWSGQYRQVVIIANRKGVKETVRDFKL